ncbi:thiol-disulfide oxidoreductase DCC family protein [Microbulbifer litoralis]|uniref:thiol-disulfide oxidoreductase DCC family protein n=1 Tax=Microbulbifer litoralis TaxID=2933965 RepID=UPI002028DEA2|nr:thiol-disulfide oxidoreductase DCC family protein [Microbulbifer sp. GX H0434]
MPPPEKIILFDSQCNLCNGWSRFVLERDRDAVFTLCRVQSPAGQQLLTRLGLPLDRYETVILLECRGDHCEQYHRSEAALRIIARLPGPWRHLALLRIVPRPLRDWIYDRIARNRYRLFGRPAQCRLPDAAEEHRFLEDLNDSGAPWKPR